MPGFAPEFKSSSMTLGWDEKAAANIKGVPPLLFLALTSAPASINALMIAGGRSKKSAVCKGVLPFLSRALGSSPHDERRDSMTLGKGE